MSFVVTAGMRGYLPNYSSAEMDESRLGLHDAREHAAELVTQWMGESWDALSEREGAWAEGERVVESIRTTPLTELANGACWDLPRELGNEIIEIHPPADAAA